MGNKLLVAVEELADDELDNPGEHNEVEGYEMRVLVNEAKLLHSQITEVRAAIGRLEAVKASIVKHGLCRATMEAVDPKGELVGLGICCAYEELSDVPTRDAEADDTVVKIDEAVESLRDELRKLAAFAATKFKDFAIGFRKFFHAFDSAIAKASIRLRSIDIDEEKFAAESIKAYSKNDFDKTLEAFHLVMDVIKVDNVAELMTEVTKFQIQPAEYDQVKDFDDKMINFFKPLIGVKVVDEYLGMTFSVSKRVHVENYVRTHRLSVKDYRDQAGRLGWRGEDAKQIVDSSNEILQFGHAIESLYNNIIELCDRLTVSYVEYVSSYTDENGELATKSEIVARKRYNYFIASIESLIDTINSAVMWMIWQPMNNLQSTILQVAEAAIKTRQ